MTTMYKDATGRPIEKGSYIAYSSAIRSRTHMRFGIVTKLKEVECDSNVYDQTTRSYNIVKKMKYSIQFICAERDYVTKGWTVKGKHGGQRRARSNFMEHFDRVIILEQNQLDPEVRDALDRAMCEIPL